MIRSVRTGLSVLALSALLALSAFLVAPAASAAPSAPAGPTPVLPNEEYRNGTCDMALYDPDCYHFENTTSNKRTCENGAIASEPSFSEAERKDPESIPEVMRDTWCNTVTTITYRCAPSTRLAGATDLFLYIGDTSCDPAVRMKDCPRYSPPN